MTPLLIAALILALIVAAWLLVYKVQHPHTETDLLEARRDSIARSRAVLSGKVQEHIAPFFPEFCAQFNPHDARFMGAPLDFIVFDGLHEGNGVRRVVFVEIKTGKAGLQKSERHVRDAIEAGNVEFQLLRLPGESTNDDVPALEASDGPAGVQP